jgi:hypothetical protein
MHVLELHIDLDELENEAQSTKHKPSFHSRVYESVKLVGHGSMDTKATLIAKERNK